MTPNEWIKEISIKKRNWNDIPNDDKKTYNKFIINLWLSMAPELIEIINETQSYSVPDRDHYNFLVKILPKKQPYLRWIKARKKEYSKDVIEHLSAFYLTSNREIYDSLCLLDEPKIISILQQTGLDNKNIKQLLK